MPSTSLAPPPPLQQQPAKRDSWRPEPARISVEQYHAMGEAGILTPADRVELLEGIIVGKPLQGPRHVEVVEELFERCRSRCDDSSFAKMEKPITLSDSEPEPDIAVVRGGRADYRRQHPSGTDCLLVIEISDSTLTRDLFQASAYAAGGVPEYWVVDLTGHRIIVHRGPTADGYSDVVTSEAARTELPGGTFEVDLTDLLAD